MPSAVAQGQHYQQRTRQYLEHLGYHVAPLQLLGWIKTATGLRPIKKDAFASDSERITMMNLALQDVSHRGLRLRGGVT